ncbi:hypothetical protein LTR10_015107 [Elasticomyces elasticus]|uniref:Cytochrome P450 n=1 Tax=Exophiala sideris TaxID=1016849 RepID=A0ABR0JQX5_9EURO|nr:hypothetical protein LTR10_015107 [Elasticomyces elasticus]KAK5034695.1 hypothetical protein LTR13_006351 [Exophiala sideris]KAK5039983.1 hypothetical protein LTS07_000478 [Exophiala sideris]KAK5068361.1 hypothetical protein LTR69_000479 [Exophiala sideris]KAK5187663.1 hypothetical protein LTR44_000479 [Eurotiomycetes sp. CCFEE 6388]
MGIVTGLRLPVAIDVDTTSSGYVTLVLFMTLIVATSILGKVIYELHFSPLRQIPGPKLAALSDLWLLHKLYRLEKCGTLERCFAQYGPIVRIGPKKIALNSIDTIKPIYGVGTRFVKSTWYETWALSGRQNVFTIIDPKAHANRRRITSQLMSHNNLIKYLPAVNHHIASLVKLIDRKKKLGEQLDFLVLYRYLALDILSSATFGKNFQLLESGQDHPFSNDLDACVAVLPPRGYVPSWMWVVVKHFPSKRWQFLLGGEQRIFDYSQNVVMEQERAPLTDPPTIIRKYLDHREEDGSALPNDIIIGETANLFFAGTDTTSNSLSFITWELASKPHIQKRLFEEVSHLAKDEVPPLEDVQGLQYLNAVLKEGLRKYAAAPSHLERVVPPGGARIDGHYLPAGTVVGVQIYSMHRNANVFVRPEEFLPERWLPENETEDMRRHFMPFGLGSRVCMGQHVAMMEMRLALVALVRHYQLVVPKGFDYSSMEMKDFWLVFPKGHSLKLDVVERSE